MYDGIPPTPALRIAVATKDGERVDMHFGHADAFRVYDVTEAGAVLIERREVEPNALPDEDPRDTIRRLIADCTVLLVAKIGATPLEQMAAAGIEASSLYAGKPIEMALAEVYAEKSISYADDAPVDASRFRLLHAMLRVADIERSLDFYARLLGMAVLERRDHKKNQFTQVYLGYSQGFGQMALELVFNWTREEPYAAGESFGHIAIEVAGITALCNRLAAAGVPMPRPPSAQRHGENIVAFIEDPDGHRIELLQRPLAAS